jgi:23S rRNA (guanine745-N1)-methyltransferase
VARSKALTENTTRFCINAVSIESLASWLRCPHCGAELDARDSLVVGCANGHRYDVNKRGYVNLVSGKRAIAGDSRPILERRDAFLGRGHYSPIADAVTAAVPARERPRVLDSGCGTGYYLERLVSARSDASALALDVSPAAVAMTSVQLGVAGVVADVWAPLPIRDAAADVVLCVFAPRNATEFARVLTEGGTLIVVTPREDHLVQLRESGALLGIQEDKLAHLDATILGAFTLAGRSSLTYAVELDAEEKALVAGMGPAGHHGNEHTVFSPGAVTVSVDVSVFRTP